MQHDLKIKTLEVCDSCLKISYFNDEQYTLQVYNNNRFIVLGPK